MGPDDLSSCLNQLGTMLERYGVTPGGLTHAVEQLKAAVDQENRQMLVHLEQRFDEIRTPSGEILPARIIDVVSRDLIDRLHIEIKTGRVLSEALDVKQLTADAALAIQQGVSNAWQLANVEINQNTFATLHNRMNQLVQELTRLGFSEEQIAQAMRSFNFVDRLGNVFRAQVTEAGVEILNPAMEVVFGPNGLVAQSAENKAKNSPDFTPAMEALFGPSGKVADAASAAAQAANLEPALDNLENKIEEGVSEAMEEAGDAVAAEGAASLGSRIAAGATALGNIFTAVPAMADAVTELGEAWNQPLDSTEAYMNLFRATGGAINQGVQLFEALAGVTQIASAAQAVFNAVMAMNPVVLVVIAVIALIAIIVTLIVYWEEVKAAVRDNPWIPAIAAIFGPIGILIGLIVLIAAHWEEVKLAVLQAANFISIQAQRIAAFFVGIWTVAGQVWDVIVATAVNAGIGIANAFISVGTDIQNFFIGVINGILEMYNEVATSAIGDVLGLDTAELIPEVDVETRLIPPREVPEIDVAAAFDTGDVTGGLEEMIAEQEGRVAAARAEDEARRAAAATAPPAAEGPPPSGAAAGVAPGPPSIPSFPASGGLPRPELPATEAGVMAAAGSVDSSVNIQGGITININAERLEADAGQLLSDEIIAQLQARLGALRAEQDFRTGVRSAA